MFKDDRLISILSGVVLMIAIGTVVQRGSPFMGSGGDSETAFAPVPDRAEVGRDGSVTVDVLANDEGIEGVDGAGERLIVHTQPSCGRAQAERGKLTYTAGTSCSGKQTVRYGLITEPDVAGELVVTLRDPAETVEETVAAVPEETASEPTATDEPVAATENEGTELSGAESDASLSDDEEPAAADDATDLAETDLAEAEPVVAAAPEAPGADPVRRMQLERPTAPTLDGGADETAAFTAPDAPSRPTTGAAAAPAGLDNAAADGSEPAGPAVVVEQPKQVAIRAPGSLNKRIGSARRDDFASATSRAGLFARPSRASTQATPSEDVIALAARAEPRPTRGTATDELTVSAPSAPRIDRQTSDIRVPEAPDGPSLAAIDTGSDSGVSRPEASPQPSTFSLTGTPGGRRVSQLSPPPVVDLARPSPGQPEGLSGGPIFAVAISPRDPSAFSQPEAPTLGQAPGGFGSTVAPSSVSQPTIGGSGERHASLSPIAPADSGIAAVRNLGRGLNIVAVDTANMPAALSAPTASDDSASLGSLSFRTLTADEMADIPAGGSAPAAEETDIAALTPGSDACTAPAQLGINPMPGGITEVTVNAPCHAGEVAILSYAGIDLAFRIAESGEGRIEVPGFAAQMEATANLPDGQLVEFPMPFEDMDQVVRVAMAWNQPVDLDLHALEIGQQIGSTGHLRPGNESNFDTVRRRGGGFLSGHESVDGIGSNLQVYTHYIRGRGTREVVKLMIDFASRREDRSPETCGTGGFASPLIRILRSERGEFERTKQRRLPKIDCANVDRLASHLIEAAVDDVIVSER